MSLSLYKRSITALSFLAASGFAVANTPSVPTFKESEIVGMFADTSWVGPKAGTKTVAEAHSFCLNSGRSLGLDRLADQNVSTQGNYHDSYKTCMRDFVPFKIAGIDSANRCESQTVSWGQCQATIPALSDGMSASVQNTFDPTQFEGYATYQCEAGALAFVGGGCSRAVKACEEGQIVNWPVTSPLWADESTKTTYTDKYGEQRHTPKGRCYARMPYATSGQVFTPTPTTPEMMEPERYNMTGSNAPQRCFDSKWMQEANSGQAACEYIPKSCQAQSFSHNGCGFDLPAAAHDTIHVDDTPTPQNSLGSVEAYCWDGTWEIKARSCTLSCSGSIGSYNWTGSDPKSCGHNGFNRGERVRPGDNVVIENVVAGMLGSVTYRCDNGQYTNLSEPCEPKGCSTIAAATWDNGQCKHSAGNYALSHGSNVTLSSEASIFTAIGSRNYRCQYGEISMISESCRETSGPKCDMTKPPVAVDSCEDMGGRIVDGKCCTVDANGQLSCGESNDEGGSNPVEPPKVSFNPIIRYDGTCMNCSQARTNGTGEMYPYPPISDSENGREISSGVSVMVDSGCIPSSDCEIREVSYSKGGSNFTGGIINSDFIKEDFLNNGAFLRFTLNAFCSRQGGGSARQNASGTIQVRHKKSGETKDINYSVSLNSWCGGEREI